MTESARIIAITVMAVVGLQIQTGVASQYAPNVMERVIGNRQRMKQLPDQLPDVEGYAAALA